MDDKQLLALIGRVDVETPGVPMAGLLRDEVKVGDYQARLLAIARAVQAAERERWQDLREKLKSDTEKPRWGLHGHSAVDDDYFLALDYVVGRMDELLAPNPQTGGSKQE